MSHDAETSTIIQETHDNSNRLNLAIGYCFRTPMIVWLYQLLVLIPFFGALIGQLIASVMSNVFLTDVQAAIDKQFNISIESTKITYFHQNFIIRFTSPQIRDFVLSF